MEIDEPSFAKGDEYQVKPDPKDKNLRPVPKFSRRAELARLTGEGASRAFNRNIGKRRWAHKMARGQSIADQSVWPGKTPSARNAPPKIMAVRYCRNAFSAIPTCGVMRMPWHCASTGRRAACFR